MAATGLINILQGERYNVIASGTAWGSTAIMDEPVLRQIAAGKGKSIAQVHTVHVRAPRNPQHVHIYIIKNEVRRLH